MARRSIFEGEKAARLIKRRKWRKDYLEQQIILKPSYRVLNGLGMAEILPSDPVEIKKKYAHIGAKREAMMSEQQLLRKLGDN